MREPRYYSRVDGSESLLYVLQELLPVKLYMWPSNHPLVEVGLSYRPDFFDSCTEEKRLAKDGEERTGEVR